jgi:hemerythrin-like domain-containing protein
MTITQALTVEHTVFRTLFEQIERDLPKLSLAETKRMASVLEGIIHRHGEQEKDLALAALNHALVEKGQFEGLQLEHHELDSALKRIQNAAEVSEARTLLKNGLSAMRQHFEHEEHGLFPSIEKVLGPKVLTELGKAVLQRKRG